jgi:hypothetical protein
MQWFTTDIECGMTIALITNREALHIALQCRMYSLQQQLQEHGLIGLFFVISMLILSVKFLPYFINSQKWGEL